MAQLICAAVIFKVETNGDAEHPLTNGSQQSYLAPNVEKMGKLEDPGVDRNWKLQTYCAPAVRGWLEHRIRTGEA